LSFDSIVYRKLVRDKIPEIIQMSGKDPVFRGLAGSELCEALGRKLLEEAFEFFASWQNGNAKEILCESADILEVILEALKEHGYNLDDLIRARDQRKQERGGFSGHIFLENVGGPPGAETEFDDPRVFLSPEQNRQLIELINQEFSRSEAAWIASAFFSPGVTNLFISAFERFLACRGVLKILLSTMGNITPPQYLLHLREQVPGAQVKVFHPPEIPFDQSPPDFHSKVYLFRRRDGSGSMIIGSSNLTQAAFSRNVEWNYFTPGEINLPFSRISAFDILRDEFDRCFTKEAVPVSSDFIAGYQRRWERSFLPSVVEDKKSKDFPGISEPEETAYGPRVKPNPAQEEALRNLAEMRSQGVRKAAIIAATGIGKTYLAAFDFSAFKGASLLYIAHRENILASALETFRSALGDKFFGSILGGGRKGNLGQNAIFAMIQTLSRRTVLESFSPDFFDYIVLDEFHHAEAASYQKVIEYFKPRFFLGLTATPERMDGRDVLALCDYQIGYEVRLLEAVDRGWLCRFQYFAVYDETDYSRIAWRGTGYDEAELETALSTDRRTDVVARNLKKFLPSHGKIKALAFCSSINHAAYTARHLSDDFGIEAIALSGMSDEEERQRAIRRLESESDPLQVICSVDIFNEGLDIPNVTHVLFLRPTQSFTVFLQQLGRGLRNSPGKEFLVAIDFVGNFRKANVAPLALAGYTSVEHFFEKACKMGISKIKGILPRGCFFSPDVEVERIWDEEIRRIISERLSPQERLSALYQDIRQCLGRSPSLTDLYGSGIEIDPMAFIRAFGNWIRAKKYCDGSLPPFEESLLETQGEAFLQHLERDLNPVRSYKMVVLTVLLGLPGGAWEVEEIAKGFLSYFLTHKDRMADYPELARSHAPEEFPLHKVVSKLKQMPLNFLSNTDKDFFILDKKRGLFSIKETVLPFWEKSVFKELVSDRVQFALLRYFRRNKGNDRDNPAGGEEDSGSRRVP